MKSADDSAHEPRRSRRTVRVFPLDPLELLFRVRAGQFDVLVAGVEPFRKVHLETLRGGNDDAASTVAPEKLGENLRQASDELSHGNAWHPFGTLTNPVGPAPNMSTVEPMRGAIFSRPWQAHEAGSSRVASTSERLLNLKTRPAV